MSIMEQIRSGRRSDLVPNSRLEASWDPSSKKTTQIHNIPGTSARQRQFKKEVVWERKKIIGSGTYGTVWCEECITDNRDGSEKPRFRAIKAIRKKASIPARYLYSELEAVAKFLHDTFAQYFVQSYGWFEDDENIFIAMEYLRYGDLQRYIEKPIPEQEVRQIAKQILEALEQLHSYNFVHRDLKPRNVMVMQKGPSWWVKLCDFGVSKRLEGSTELKTVVGTEEYMAPELRNIRHPSDVKSLPETPRFMPSVDIWSLGEMVYRLLTNKAAFETPPHLCQYVIQGSPFPMEDLSMVQASVECVQFIQCAMDALPKTRLTAAEGLQHKWFEDYVVIEDNSERSSIESIRDFEDAPDEHTGRWTTDIHSTETFDNRIGGPSQLNEVEKSSSQNLTPSESDFNEMKSQSLTGPRPSGAADSIPGMTRLSNGFNHDLSVVNYSYPNGFSNIENESEQEKLVIPGKEPITDPDHHSNGMSQKGSGLIGMDLDESQTTLFRGMRPSGLPKKSASGYSNKRSRPLPPILGKDFIPSPPLVLPSRQPKELYALINPTSQDMLGVSRVNVKESGGLVPFLFIHYDDKSLSSHSEGDRKAIEKIGERVARENGLPAFWVIWAEKNASVDVELWEFIDIAHCATKVLLVSGSTNTSVSDNGSIRSWHTSLETICVLLCHLKGGTIFLCDLGVRERAHSVLQKQPGKVINSLMPDNKSVKILEANALGPETLNDAEELICIMDVLHTTVMKDRGRSMAEYYHAMASYFPRRVKLDTNDTLLQAFFNLSLGNEQFELFERWLCTCNNRKLEVACLQDSWSPLANHILPLCAAVSVNHHGAVRLRYVRGDRIELGSSPLVEGFRQRTYIVARKSRFLILPGHLGRGVFKYLGVTDFIKPLIRRSKLDLYSKPSKQVKEWTLLDWATMSAAHFNCPTRPNFIAVMGEDGQGYLRAMLCYTEVLETGDGVIPMTSSNNAHFTGAVHHLCTVRLRDSLEALYCFQEIEIVPMVAQNSFVT